jgi:ribonuclease T2
MFSHCMQVKDGKLAYSDHTTFYADHPPKGRTQSNVYASQGGRPIEIEITWASK